MATIEKTVGVFTVTQLEPGRWRVVNTLTTFAHITYGSETEITAVLTEQTRSWRAKFEQTGKHKGKAGSAWRTKNETELAQIKAARSNETP